MFFICHFFVTLQRNDLFNRNATICHILFSRGHYHSAAYAAGDRSLRRFRDIVTLKDNFAKMKKSLVYILLSMLSTTIACTGKTSEGNDKQSDNSQRTATLGAFNSDSAYRFVAEQVAFGPRNPNSEGHTACGNYLVEKLSSYNPDTVIVQESVLTAYNGDKLDMKNIMARYNTKASNRVLLAAHWDTRPWADMESSIERRSQPIIGANDGASGVAVLLEIARNLSIKAPACGVDILFVDDEDYGNSDGFTNNDNTWCLGTQYWVKNMPYKDDERKPAYGILLDMVGGQGAKFHREYYSHLNARAATVKVWGEASMLGYESTFVNKVGGTAIDDHVFLTEAGIPTTDIIENMNEHTLNFPPTWHTHEDNLENISKESLDIVGKTVLNVIYKEKMR